MHSVEAANKGGLAAAGWPNQCGRVIRWDVQVDVLQDVVGAIPRVKILDLNAYSH
jgi:hypothetical protein